MVAKELEGIATFDEAYALVDEPLELSRFDLGAVLLGLAPALLLLVRLERAFDAVDVAVEQVDERPEQVGKIVLEPRADKRAAQRVDHGVEMNLHGLGIWQRPRIGFVLART